MSYLLQEKLAKDITLDNIIQDYEKERERKAKRNKILKKIGIGAGVATGVAAAALGTDKALRSNDKTLYPDEILNKDGDSVLSLSPLDKAKLHYNQRWQNLKNKK